MLTSFSLTMNYSDPLPQFATSTSSITTPDYTMTESSMQSTLPCPNRRPSRGSSGQKDSRHRRSVRIEKPRSIHNSPKPADRRRATAASKRYTTLDDHFNMMFGYTDSTSAEEEQDRSNVRPVSWHPGQTKSYASELRGTSRPREDSGDSYTSLYESSLPFQHHSQDYSSYANSVVAVESYANSPSLQDRTNNQNESYRLSTHSAFNGQPAPWSVPDWVQMTQTRSRSNSSPLSPSLPIQASIDSEHASECEYEEGGRALVGMGLYDPPEGYDSWFASASGEPTGKGLKLEETFEPLEEKDEDSDSAQEEDEDEEMEETKDDASSDEISVEDLPLAPAAVLDPMAATKQPSHLPVNMSGQSFFIEEDESLQNEWWYQRIRSSAQPSAHGIGYGWL